MATTPETTAETAIRPDKAARDMTATELAAWREAHPWLWRAYAVAPSRVPAKLVEHHDHEEFCFDRLMVNLRGLPTHKVLRLVHVQHGKNGERAIVLDLWPGFIDAAYLCAEISGFEERHRAMDFAVLMHLAKSGKSWDETGADPEQFAACNVFAKAVSQIRASTRRV